jgi:DNA-binding PadR family transcriptional regulator
MQLLVMLGVHVLGDNSQGNHVANVIINTTKNHYGLKKSVYVILHRMRDRGWLHQWVGGSLSPRPYYSLTPTGRSTLKRTLREIEAMSAVAKEVLDEVVNQ